MKNAITISQSLKIKASQEFVWNFTQNFDNRAVWDNSVLLTKMLQKLPYKLIYLKMKGGLRTNLKYKLCRKPLKTSLVMENTRSFLFSGGGGSWNYEEENGIVEWTQKNTLIVKYSIFYWCFKGYIKTVMEKQTRQAMINAKTLIEDAQ